ncbi:MAG: protein-disulfide reductase DsbD domain-containing protein [Planctomycetota bacterium]|jgi:DsbC/DsbD-like thiol-disulfide interchange protein
MIKQTNSCVLQAAAMTLLAAAVTASLRPAPAEQAAETPPEQPVKAQILGDAKSVVAGEALTVGVLFEIAEGWHIYWKNPGEAGLATEIEFDLPEGFTAGPIRWPAPETFEQPGEITGYGYAGEVMLTSTITPPDELEAGAEVTITAEASWLACEEKCVPGEQELTLKLAVAEQAKVDNQELFEKWRSKMAPPAPAFALADQDGSEVSLADFAGKVVVLEWINPDCPFVRRHHVKRKTMVELAGKYAEKGVVWLAANSTHYMDRQASKKWHSAWELPYPILVDTDGEVGRAYAAKTTPHMFVIDQAGGIVYQGAIDSDPSGKDPSCVNYVDAALEELLAGKPVGRPRTRPYGCSVKYAK